jgi:aspartyl/asparaginyl beta-hydroxylase (cupin superfamily)
MLFEIHTNFMVILLNNLNALAQSGDQDLFAFFSETDPEAKEKVIKIYKEFFERAKWHSDKTAELIADVPELKQTCMTT